MTRGIAYAIGFIGLSLSASVTLASVIVMFVVACHG